MLSNLVDYILHPSQENWILNGKSYWIYIYFMVKSNIYKGKNKIKGNFIDIFLWNFAVADLWRYDAICHLCQKMTLFIFYLLISKFRILISETQKGIEEFPRLKIIHGTILYYNKFIIIFLYDFKHQTAPWKYLGTK